MNILVFVFDEGKQGTNAVLNRPGATIKVSVAIARRGNTNLRTRKVFSENKDKIDTHKVLTGSRKKVHLPTSLKISFQQILWRLAFYSKG